MKPLSHNGLVILKVQNADPRETYAGLLWVAAYKGYRHGWVCHKFKTIFGKWPRPTSKVEPAEPNKELREWLGIMNGRYKAQKKREEQRLEQANEGLETTVLMTPEDWEVKL